MFTPDQLRERMYEHLKPRNILALDATDFGPENFESLGSEQSAAIHRAPTALTTDPIRFWVSSVAHLHWWHGRGGGGARSKFIKESLCRHLSESQFNSLAADTVGGIVRPKRVRLPLHRGTSPFLGAMQMRDDCDFVSALAAYENELIAFHWLMTA